MSLGEPRRIRDRMRWIVLGAGACLAICASGPPPEGGTIGGGAGAGRLQYRSIGGCNAPVYQNTASYYEAAITATDRRKSGLTLSGNGALRFGEVKESILIQEGDSAPSDPTSNLGETMTQGWFAGRVGYHMRFGGGDVGLAWIMDHSPGSVTDIPFVSGHFWAGHPRTAFLWIELLASEVPFGAGVGHRSERVRLDLGITQGLNNAEGGLFRVSLPVRGAEGATRRTWLGLQGSYIDDDQWQSMLVVSFEHP